MRAKRKWIRVAPTLAKKILSALLEAGEKELGDRLRERIWRKPTLAARTVVLLTGKQKRLCIYVLGHQPFDKVRPIIVREFGPSIGSMPLKHEEWDDDPASGTMRPAKAPGTGIQVTAILLEAWKS